MVFGGATAAFVYQEVFVIWASHKFEKLPGKVVGVDILNEDSSRKNSEQQINVS